MPFVRRIFVTIGIHESVIINWEDGVICLPEFFTSGTASKRDSSSCLGKWRSSQQAHSSERLMAFLVRRQALSSGYLPYFFVLPPALGCNRIINHRQSCTRLPS